MAELVIGVLHPGEMGAALASALRERGHEVVWASDGRGPETVRRAAAASLRDAGSVTAMAEECDLIVSVCPPHAAVATARQVVGFTGVYVDANAVAPASARAIGELVTGGGATFVDGGIIGPPPYEQGTTRLYLSGAEAEAVAGAFAGTALSAAVVSAQPGDASALKMAYAAWTKGSAALLLAARALARCEGVEAELVHEWSLSLPELHEASVRAARSATAKGWRWVGEMDEIAAAHADAGLPDGFHRAAAEVFGRAPRRPAGEDGDEALELVLGALVNAPAGVTDSQR
jgi:3-hydroxyisobutyrate dehydrogenase-like beta-hydroxyacid dehydrogenase